MFGWLVPYPITSDVILQIINIFFLTILITTTPILLKFLECEISEWSAFLLFIPLGWNYIFINGLIDGAGLFYCYDIPSLAFYVIGLILFIKRSWIWFYITFILANLNRESACFISITGFILLMELSKNTKLFLQLNKNLIIHIIAQAILWILLRFLLCWTYQDNPGFFFEEPHSMSDFLSGIWHGQSHWAMENAAWFLTLFAGIWFLPILLFNYLGYYGRRLLIVSLIYLISLYFRSNMMETRVYNELNVIISLCAIISMNNFVKSKHAQS